MWSNSPAGRVGAEQGVDAVDDPAEEPSVQRLAHGVPHLGGLLHRVGPDDGLATRHHTVRRQRLLQLVAADAQQRRHWGGQRSGTLNSLMNNMFWGQSSIGRSGAFITGPFRYEGYDSVLVSRPSIPQQSRSSHNEKGVCLIRALTIFQNGGV